MRDLSDQEGSAPQVAKDVNYERILEAREKEPHNWLTYYGDYDGKRYSLLDQINKDNVDKLLPAWVFQFGSQGLHAGPSTYAFEAAPIIVDGVMYVSGWDGLLWAVDAKKGNLLWQYKHAIPFDVSLCCGNVNRGVAVGHGKVFMATLNAHVVAIDSETGEKVWDTIHGDVRAGESATVAPLLVKDKVIVGSSGGEFGSRGHLDAYNVETGERVWRCYMVPKPGEPGFETWPEEGEAWQRGGGNCWVTGTFDPETNNLYWGTGNPAPDFDGEVREGDNLYTDSVVAIDVDTGEKQWHYQCTPHDLWDYDSNMECILFEKDGRKLLAHFDKNGYCLHPRPPERRSGKRYALRRPHQLGRDRRRGQRYAEHLSRERGRGSPLLPRAGWRQGMDARLLQPGDGALLRSRSGHRLDGRAPSQGVQGGHPLLGSRRYRGLLRPGRRHHRLRHRRQGSVEVGQPDPDVRLRAHHRGRPRVRRVAARRVPRARCGDR